MIDRLGAALAGRYRIERELGAGGMATVYLAHDVRHDRKVALKVLKPELAAVLGAERFVVEIKTTAALQHPHILPLFDSGSADGFLYYVMPFIDGETLRSKLNRETQLGIDEAVRITSQVADALDYAHRHGVIHRDIKPENILLHDGRPMVADFGIALALSAAAGGRMTETGLSLGTPHYMSPEQATADKEITGRSDIYSLASVLYEMLAGNPPHIGASAQQIIMKIVAEEAVPVTKLRKSVPPNVAAAISKALERLPADRFDSAAKFAEALHNPGFGAVAGEPGPRAAVRYSWTVLVGVLLLGTGLGGLAVRWLTGSSALPVMADRQQLTFNGLAGKAGISPDGNFVAFVETVCEHAGLSLCKSSLVLKEVGSTQSRILLTGAAALRAPRWSHDGLTVIVGGELAQGREGLFAVSRLTGTPQRIGPLGAYDTHPAADSVMVLPDDAPGRALVITLGSGAVVDTIPIAVQGATDISWAPEGQRIAARVPMGLQFFGRDGGRTDSIAVGHLRPMVRWNPAGTALLFFVGGTIREDQFVQLPVSGDGRVAGPVEVLQRRIPTLYRGGFDVARRSGVLAVETGDANTDIWSFDLSVRPPRGRRETRGTTWYGTPGISRDGRFIYYYQGDTRGDNVYARDLATGIEEALTAQSLPGGDAVRFSRDGKRLVYAHNSPSGSRLEYIEFPSRQTFSVAAPIWTDVVEPVSSRGFAASHARTGELMVVDSLNGEWRTVATPGSLIPVNFAASPDGSRFAVTSTVHTRATDWGSDIRRAVRNQVVGTVSLADGAFVELGRFSAGEPVIGLVWENERSLFLTRWLETEELPSLWRMTIADGRLTRVATIPAACYPISMSLDESGRRATCRVDDYRSDIWLMTVPGVTR